MKVYELVPNKKIGLLEFGMKRELVRDVMGEFVEFKKSKFSKNTTDDFGDCHVFYDQGDALKAVEFFNDAQLKYEDKNIFDFSFEELIDFLKSIDQSLEVNEDSVVSKILGVNVFAPNGGVETVLVFNEEYYKAN